MNQYNKIRGPIMGPIIILILLLCVALTTARAATITVTEVGDGLDVHTNLRQALADANDGDTIEFDPQLSGYTLGLIRGLGQLVVNKNLPIIGLGVSHLAVDAQHNDRVFYISPGKTVTISGLAITNGVAPAPNYSGGGVYNDHANLTLSNCAIIRNSADRSVGGGVYNHHGTLTVRNCTISANSAYYGGGIASNWAEQ